MAERAAEWQQTTGRKKAQNREVREAIWQAEGRQKAAKGRRECER